MNMGGAMFYGMGIHYNYKTNAVYFSGYSSLMKNIGNGISSQTFIMKVSMNRSISDYQSYTDFCLYRTNWVNYTVN